MKTVTVGNLLKSIATPTILRKKVWYLEIHGPPLTSFLSSTLRTGYGRPVNILTDVLVIDDEF
jgi:hypothetical protein